MFVVAAEDDAVVVPLANLDSSFNSTYRFRNFSILASRAACQMQQKTLEAFMHDQQ